jgi:inorganic pyrophosphatase
VLRPGRGKGDDKLIPVAVDDPEYQQYRAVGELPAHRMQELQRFFLDYKALEGKPVQVDKPLGPAEGLRILREAVAAYAAGKPK